MRLNWLLICLALLVGCSTAQERADDPLVGVTVTDYDELPARDAWIAGKADALVTIHAFMDPTSTQFGAVWAHFERLNAEHDGEVRLALYPPSNPSPAGYDVLVALRAAALQGRQVAAWEQLVGWGKSWQSGGAIALTASLADKIDLDQEKFRVAVEEGVAATMVDQEAKWTAESGLDGALTLNGRPYFLPMEPRWLDQAVAVTKEGAQTLVAAGAQPTEIYARHAAVNADLEPFGHAFVDSEVVPVGESPTFGNRAGEVKVVAFMDFQCPYSKRAAATIAQLVANNDEVEIVFKHMPLPFHKQAREAAAISVAAAAQGKFWEMSELLFLNQQRFKDENMDELAAELGNKLKLDVSRLLADRDRAYPVVDADIKLAGELEVRGTPHFFMNGMRISGAQPLQRFEETLEEQLRFADSLGVDDAELYAAAVKLNYGPPETPRVAERKPDPEYAVVPVEKDDPIKGPRTGYLVTIVEFSDYQCPFCQRVEPTLEEVAKKFPNEVRIVFRHQPLPFHTSAEQAAWAAVAAGKQGKYWQMHELLFADKLPAPDEMDAYTEKLAKKLRLKMAKFKKDRDAADAKVKADMALAAQIGARGTPTFFINGRRFVGAQPLPSFEEAIEEQLEFAEKVRAETKLKDDALYDEILKRRAEE